MYFKLLYARYSCLLLLLSPLNAQWSNDLNENTIVSLFTSVPTLVTNGENGVIVFSQSRDVNPLIRAQAISVKGELLWPGLQGVRVSNAKDAQWIRETRRDERFVLPDGEGGAYIAYQVGKIIGQLEEPPEPIYATSVFVQRLDASGNRLFGNDGLRLMPIMPDTFEFSQQIMNMIPDGKSGIFVLWIMGTAVLTELNGVFLTRIDKNGKALWESKRLTQRTGNTYLPYLDHNFNLNLYEYPGETVPPGGLPDRFLKVDANSGELITSRTIELGTGKYGFNAFYDFTPSDNGSAIFAFYDFFMAETLRIQKLDSNGNKLWGEKPIKVTQNLIRRNQFEIQSDREDGAYLWYQTIDTVLHVIHIDGKGMISWEHKFGPHRLGKFPLLISPKCHRPMTVGLDGSVFILTDGFQVVTKISKFGDIIWETRISNRANIASNIDSYESLADSDGGCIVVWEEVGNFVGLRAQRVDRYGNLGGTTPVEDRQTNFISKDFIFESPYPNPFNNRIKISFSIPENLFISIKIYDILGREVITLKEEKYIRGRHVVFWNGNNKQGKKLPTGIYFIVLRSKKFSLSKKLLWLK